MRTFLRLLREMEGTYVKKNADYAGDHGTYFNFEYAAAVAAPFRDPVDKVFATLIGVKLARLATLKGSGRKPKNEPVTDTHKDLTTYCGIWNANELDKAVRRLAKKARRKVPVDTGSLRRSTRTR